MSKLAFDYSKWDNIEISDDEADTHPNIDKASWFRMKHRSRVEREETEKMEKTAMEKENKADSEREREIVRLLAEVRSGGDAAEYEDEDALVGELEEVRGGVASNVASRRWRMGASPPPRAVAASRASRRRRALEMRLVIRRRRATARREHAIEQNAMNHTGPRPRQGPPRQDRLHGEEQEVERRQLESHGHGSDDSERERVVDGGLGGRDDVRHEIK